MKGIVLILLIALFNAECRKLALTLDKSANTAFINMEGGGGTKPAVKVQPQSPVNSNPKQPITSQLPKQPIQPSLPSPTPKSPTPSVTQSPTKTLPQSLPSVITPKTSPPQPMKPNQIKPVPVNPAPVANPITTPGPGSVKQLITFYDSQGKSSPVRPYSYSQSVKQG